MPVKKNRTHDQGNIFNPTGLELRDDFLDIGDVFGTGGLFVHEAGKEVTVQKQKK